MPVRRERSSCHHGIRPDSGDATALPVGQVNTFAAETPLLLRKLAVPNATTAEQIAYAIA